MTGTEIIHQPKFDYGTMVPEIASGLRSEAVLLRGLITKSTADMIEAGRVLLAIKDRLNHGQFMSWVEAEVGISIRTAQGYMRFAKLGDGKSETVSLLPPPTVRLLAAKSAPPEIVEQVITKAAAGNIMPERVVKNMISEKRADLRHLDRLKREAERESRLPKAAREREKRRRLEYEAERERKRAENTARAQSIIDRLSPEDLRFFAATLTWEVYDEFLRLVTDGAA